MHRINILLISKFLVYSLNGNFRISILINVNLKPTAGVNFIAVDNDDYLTAGLKREGRYSPQKLL